MCPKFQLVDDYWHLSIENAKKMREPSQIWTRFRSHLVRSFPVAVVEPESKNIWLIGGRGIHMNYYNPLDPDTTDVLEVSFKFNISSLRNISLDYASRFISSKDGAMKPSHFPIALKKEIGSYREKFHICDAEKGCQVCQYSHPLFLLFTITLRMP